MASKIYDYSKEELQKLLDESTGYGEVLDKIGLGKKGRNPDTLKKAIALYNLDETKLNENRNKKYIECAINTHIKTRKPLSELLKKHSTYQGYKLLLRLYEEGIKIPKCECCGITEWNGKPLSFQLHHEDGDITNNELENLKVICPNCHSQTENYAGKSSRKSRKK